MAAQAIMIADTIAGMKRAISKRDDASDSDESILQPTNRGNKLKRKAKYVQEGILDLPNGPRVYRRKIEHAGYQRFILNHNPPRYDEDGDELDDEEPDAKADIAAAEQNPYFGIRLEETLAPLTAARLLPEHPSLSIPYLSKNLTSIVEQSNSMVHKERASLWKIKQLLTNFRGDESWVPCGTLQTDNDILLFGRPQREAQHTPATSVSTEDKDNSIEGRRLSIEQEPVKKSASAKSLDATIELVARAENTSDDDDVAMIDARRPTEVILSSATIKDSKSEGHAPKLNTQDKTTDSASDTAINTQKQQISTATLLDRQDKASTDKAGASDSIKDLAEVSDAVAEGQATEENGMAVDGEEGVVDGDRGEDEAEEEESPPVPHRMTTRAQAQAASDNTTTAQTRSASPASSIDVVHPFFLIPHTAKPDREFGLPAQEADETRRLLLLYVQKQEEVCRGSERLYEGLLKANRMRKSVLEWAKAEAHLDEMSDGEDWYDKEYWGLEEDLKKGHEEEEEDATTQGKKTRARRA